MMKAPEFRILKQIGWLLALFGCLILINPVLAGENQKRNEIAKARGIQTFDDLEILKKKKSSLEFGNYHALLIANNDYTSMPPLQSAIRDAEDVAHVLEDKFGFKVTFLKNTNRNDFLIKLNKYLEQFEEKDNVLIFYAGHGILDEDGDGYWMPVDANKKDDAKWVSITRITKKIKHLKARHVMVIADSCYSGSLLRGGIKEKKFTSNRQAWLKRIYGKKSRTALVSGGLEPVLDGGGNENSVFATALLKSLKSLTRPTEAQQLSDLVKEYVVNNADQTPEYSNIRKTGHDGGEFIFAPKVDLSLTQNDNQCWNINTHRPYQIIPLSVAQSIGRVDSPYWFRISGKNSCKKTLHVTLRLKAISDTAVEFQKTPDKFSVLPGMKFDRNVDPVLRFLNPNFQKPTRLKMQWRIEDERGVILDQETTKITLLPKNNYLWNISSGDERKTSKEFLIASLAAWSSVSRNQYQKFKKIILNKINYDLMTDPMENWIRNLYAVLSKGEDKLNVDPKGVLFPPNGTMYIAAPDEVLDDHFGSQLEVALAFSSLSRKWIRRHNGYLSIFATPKKGQFGKKDIFLLWSKGGDEWRGVSISEFNKLSFNDNVNFTRKWLLKPEALKMLRTASRTLNKFFGVSYASDTNAFVIELRLAQESYGIIPLR